MISSGWAARCTVNGQPREKHELRCDLVQKVPENLAVLENLKRYSESRKRKWFSNVGHKVFRART